MKPHKYKQLRKFKKKIKNVSVLFYAVQLVIVTWDLVGTCRHLKGTAGTAVFGPCLTEIYAFTCAVIMHLL